MRINQIEIATGAHPFDDLKDSKISIFDILTKIADHEPPKLDSNKFSDEFCDFVEKWY